LLSAAPVVDLPPNPGYRDPKWPKVQEAWDFFFSTSDSIEAHCALDDAKHEAIIVSELYKLGKFRE
jgi:DNA polymerase III subunit epsilon